MTRFGPSYWLVAAGFSAVLASAALADDRIGAGAEAFDAGDHAAALAAWLPLAEAGDATAQFNVGLLHDQGHLGDRDLGAALDWLERAAAQGDARAAFSLGLIHDEGDGVPRDMAAAVRWYAQAGEAGDALAQFRLGQILMDGDGVLQDEAAAARWMLMAGEQNHAEAQFALATMYAMGRGVERSLGTANQWNERADVSQMSGVSSTACNLRSVDRLAECRRVVPQR